MASRDINDMHPEALPRFVAFEETLKARGINFVRACTFRSPAEQDNLYAQGRSKPGNIVTHAKGGQSDHNYQINGKPASIAADYYPIMSGKLADRKTKAEKELWAEMAAVANECGIRWGGRWEEPKTDYPHFYVDLESLNAQLNETRKTIDEAIEEIEKLEAEKAQAWLSLKLAITRL